MYDTSNFASSSRVQATLTPENTKAMARKSTNDEGAAKSIEDQIESCFETAAEWGLPLTEAGIIEEKAGLGGNVPWKGYVRSGLDGDIYTPEKTRPGLTKIMEGVLAGTIKCVIVWAQDRLWRDASLCGIAIDIFADKGCLIFDRHGAVDVISAEGRAKVLSNAVHAQNQRERAREDTKRGKSKSRNKGQRIITANVLGFRNDLGQRGGVIHIEEEQQVVRRIFRLFLAGENGSGPLTVQGIANKLMKEGFVWMSDRHDKRSTRRTEHTKHVVYTVTVRRTLVDCRYVGRQYYAKHETPCAAFLKDGECVVPLADFEKAQKKILDLKRGSNATRNANALASLIRCGVCGQTMYAGSTHAKVDGQEKIVRAWLALHSGSWCWCTHDLPVLTFPVLDDYINTVLAPLLLAEVEEQVGSSGQTALRDQRAALSREFAEVEQRLTVELPAAMARCIAEGTSVKLIGAAEKVLEAQAADLKTRLRAAEAALDAFRRGQEQVSCIDAVPESLRRDALRSVLRWVAVVPSNLPKIRNQESGYQWVSNSDAGRLVFLTSWGTVHTACIYRAHVSGRSKRKCLLRPALPEECLTSVAMLPEPDTFINGLRRSYAGNKYPFNPDEVSPGYPYKGGAEPLAEFSDVG